MRSLSDVYARCNFCILEPENFEETYVDKDWKKAMEEEIHAVDKNKTLSLVGKPKDKEIIGVKWIYKVKLNLDDSFQKKRHGLLLKVIHKNLKLTTKKFLY